MQTTNSENTLQHLVTIAGQSKGWLKFLGVLMIIYGIIVAFSLVGILIAWLPIWMGVLLFQAGNRADEALFTKDPNQLVTMMSKLKTFFIIQGVLAIIALIALTIAMIGVISTGGTLFSILQGL